jgi:predicted ribosome quality control (RQC) complex YloA/Tae2 family protein
MLQDVWSSGDTLFLEFYTSQGSLWLGLDLQIEAPRLRVLAEKPKSSKTPKPAMLFVKAHFVPRRLTEFLVDTKDRILMFQFDKAAETFSKKSKRSLENKIEVILVPHAGNLRAFAGGKNISWHKPKELPHAELQSEIPAFEWDLDAILESSRGKPQFENQKEESRSETATVVLTAKAKELQKVIQKKSGALQKILESLPQLEEIEQWIQLGEWLKWNSAPSPGLREKFDAQKSLAENRDGAFAQAKLLKRKREGGLERHKTLSLEIEKLRAQLETIDKEPQDLPAKPLGLKQKITYEGRTLHLEVGLQAVMGKSAKDNLSLLRKARAWDYWLHLRDYPSAHAIIFREKSQKVSELDLQKVGQWLVQQSLSKKVILSGGQFTALLAECRFVRPVKGSPGKVIYQHERTFSIRMNP